MSRTPDIRFKGFLGDWEHKTLGEIGIAKSGTGFPDKEQGGTQGIPFYKVSDMNTPGNETILRTANNYVSEEQVARNKWKPIDAVPAIFFAKVGAAVLLNRKRLCLESFLLDNNTMAYSMNQSEWDTNYAKAFFDTLNLPSLCQPGPLPSYNTGDVEGLNILIPKTAEQKVIGQLFSDLDTLIEQNQSEVDRLRNLKKAMLQKMFPQNGAKVPEIRFKGFSGDWETKKLGNMASFSKGSGYSKSDLAESGVPVVLYGRMYTNYRTVITDVDTFAEPKSGAVYSRGGEVVVPASGETAEDISIASVVSRPGIILGGDLNVITPYVELDSVFLALAISFGSAHNEMAMRAQGASIFHLHNSDLMTINLMFPEKSEQLMIGQYFQNLDSLIEQRQSNTDRLRNLKQAMLQRMFV